MLDLVAAIPAGHVMTYGDVARCVGGGGARQVGRVLSELGGAVPWWRVVRADGTAAPRLAHRAAQHWRVEHTPMRADGRRVDLTRARWDAAPG